jgi:thiamine-phosphate pyrophosphorylase
MTGRGLSEALRLMVITDPSARLGIPQAVEGALSGGSTAIQMRWKNGSAREMVELGHELRRLTSAAGALLIVNDRIDVALAISADGAHVGDDDLPLRACRGLVSPGFILGRSVDNPEEAVAAEADGADYVGFGPIFSTVSKDKLGAAVGIEAIAAVRNAIGIPLVAIGGITASQARFIISGGADGVAVIAAVMGSEDPERSSSRLVREISAGVSERVQY